MYKLHNYVNGSSPPINATNLNEMDLGIASGCTYVATCGSAASAIAKSVTIADFATDTLTASPGVPFVLYVLFTNGSTSATMSISINNGTARNVRYRNATSGINSLSINANDMVAFVYSSGVYYLLGAISAPLQLIDVGGGGTGRSALQSNAILVGNGQEQVKLIRTASGAMYATSADAAPTFGPLPIAQGGTGATDAANARTNLGVPTIYTGTTEPSNSLGSNGDIYFMYTA